MSNSDSALGIEWTTKAKGDLARLPGRDADRVREAVKRFAKYESGDVKRLKASSQTDYRLRVGEWRVRFRIQAGNARILRVLHRREAYRKSGWIDLGLPSDRDLRSDETESDVDQGNAEL